jgi:hypothetical protein
MDEEPDMSYAHPLTIKDIIVEDECKANAKQVGGAHYSVKAIQPWDYIIANDLGYLEGNVVKYVSRWKDKGGIEDLKKAQHYLQKLIETHDKERVV